MLLLEDRRFYVYVYLDPTKPGEYKYGEYEFDREPFYVGKGLKEQYLKHIKEANYNFINGNQLKLNKIRKIIKIGKQPIIVKKFNNLNEYKAFHIEKDMILKIGRIDLRTGQLTNMTNGGDGVSGYIQTEYDKKNQSVKISGANNGMYGKKHTEEAKQKMRGSRPNFHPVPPHLGKHLSEEHKKKISLKLRGRSRGPNSAYTRKKISNSLKGKLIYEKNPKARLICINGIYYGCIKAASEKLNIKYDIVLYRLKKGFSNYQYVSSHT